MEGGLDEDWGQDVDIIELQRTVFDSNAGKSSRPGNSGGVGGVGGREEHGKGSAMTFTNRTSGAATAERDAKGPPPDGVVSSNANA